LYIPRDRLIVERISANIKASSSNLTSVF
jgi:hypothetical protein